MDEAYQTILQEGCGEFTLSRSRFIGWAKPISTEEDARFFIEGIRKQHWDASHHAWAYVLSPAKLRYSDDGEPQGTAGLPILDILRKEGLREVALVVTRYFGGVKLGTGGLARAYAKGAKTALEAGKVIWRRPYLSCSIRVAYAAAKALEREFDRKGYIRENTAYAEQVTISVFVPPDEEGIWQSLAMELTSGQCVFLPSRVEYLRFLDGRVITPIR